MGIRYSEGECSLNGFLSVMGESIDSRSRKLKEGLDGKVKLLLYRTPCKVVLFKVYVHGACDAGSRLMFKFRSGTHGLNEELGRHRGSEVMLNVRALVMFCGIVRSTIL